MLSKTPSVENWLNRLTPKVSKQSWYELRKWLTWLQEQGEPYDPEELLKIQKKNGGYEVLDLMQRYLLTIEGREGYKRRIYANLRSYFLHNRAELPRDRSFTLRGDKPSVVGSLTVEEFKLILGGFNKLYRAVFLSMFQGGMGLHEFEYWNETGYEDLKHQLDLEESIIKIELPGRKKNRNIRPYYTYIGADSIQALRDYFKERPRGTHIFINQYGKVTTKYNIQKYFLRHLKRTGIVKKPEDPSASTRYGKSPHELRDLFRTRWQKSGASSEVAEFCMGHVVDPLGYNKAFRDPDYVRREYRRALPWLNILSGDPEKVPRDNVEELKERIRELENYQRTLGILSELVDTPEKREKLRKILEEP